jgi:hypothetical protein
MEFVGDTCRGFPRGIAEPTYHQAQGIASPRGKKFEGPFAMKLFLLMHHRAGWLLAAEASIASGPSRFEIVYR